MDISKFSERESVAEFEERNRKHVFKIIKLVFFSVCVLIGGLICIGPIYNVWEQKLVGEAELARADSNRKIAVLEAQAHQESAKSLAEAEIIRARGVAEANKIIGSSLEGNESYLRYLWIQTLNSHEKEVIYVPTEANLPILEANRLKK